MVGRTVLGDSQCVFPEAAISEYKRLETAISHFRFFVKFVKCKIGA